MFDADGEDRERDLIGAGSSSSNPPVKNAWIKEVVKSPLAPDQFPALPGPASGSGNSAPAKIDTKPALGSYANTILSPLSPLGKWDDDVAAMEEEKEKEEKEKESNV